MYAGGGEPVSLGCTGLHAKEEGSLYPAELLCAITLTICGMLVKRGRLLSSNCRDIQLVVSVTLGYNFIYLSAMSTVLPGDFGPIYAETVIGRLPVEPFNTVSNLIFLMLVVLFARRTRLDAKRFPVTVLTLPILLVGFVGGTLYHATRAHNIWLILDFVPIAVLVMLACLYFWERILGYLWLAALVTPFPGIMLRWLVSLLGLPRTLMISASYVALAVSILMPAFILCARTEWRHVSLLISAVLSFAIAVFFRIADSYPAAVSLFPMGTHFLWHLFGGVSTWLLLEFVFHDEQSRTMARRPADDAAG